MRESYLPIFSSSIMLNQPSRGDTHLLYGILLSLLPRVTIASTIKRFPSDCQYLTPLAAHSEKQPLLIFVSHMFWVQRKKLTYYEVLDPWGVVWKHTALGHFMIHPVRIVTHCFLCLLQSGLWFFICPHVHNMLLAITIACTESVLLHGLEEH